MKKLLNVGDEYWTVRHLEYITLYEDIEYKVYFSTKEKAFAFAEKEYEFDEKEWRTDKYFEYVRKTENGYVEIYHSTYKGFFVDDSETKPTCHM